MLFRSNKVMYDRATRSLWHQFTGTPIVGELVGSGIELGYFPTARTTWGDWRAEHPDTTVITREGARYAAWTYTHENSQSSIYFDYRADPETMFPIAFRDDVLAPKEEVLGVSLMGIDKAYPIRLLREQRIVHDSIGDVEVVVIASATSSDAHIFDNPDGLEFRLSDDAPEAGFPDKVVDQGGNEWAVTREKLVDASDPSNELNVVPSNVSFWFGWFAFHRGTELYGR